MGVLASAAGAASEAAAAGLPFPEGDPEALRAAAKQAEAAAHLLASLADAVGGASGQVGGWAGDGAERFRSAITDEQETIRHPVAGLQRAGTALDALAREVDEAQDEVVRLATRVREAEEAAERAAAASALAVAAAGVAADAVDLAGADPPVALERAAGAADDVADAAARGATTAREHADRVRAAAVKRAKGLCDDVRAKDAAAAGAVDGVQAPIPLVVMGPTPGQAYAQAVSRHMTVTDWKGLAFLKAGINAKGWYPSAGLDANDATVRRVYAYYERMGLERDEFQWMKVAAIGGPLFYAGFKDIAMTRDALAGGDDGRRELLGREAPLDAFGDLTAEDAAWHEEQFLKMQKAIFTDLAWQHEAFALGGAGAIRRAHDQERESSRLDVRTVRTWEDIGSGDPGRVEQGNLALIEREQGPVIQRYWNEMRQRHGVKGDVTTYAMTRQAQSPFEKADSYREFSHVEIPYFFDLRGTPAGNVSNYRDRIAWIKQELWPAHQELLRTPGAAERELGKDFDEQVKRFQALR